MADAAADPNSDQISYWNGEGGQRWTERQQMQDVLLAPVLDVLLTAACAASGETVIDIGCGCGCTTIAFAERVAPSGHAIGVDVSAPMLERARHMTPKGIPAKFVLADATVYPFPPASADLMVSRFGVMFFADPARSFANMRTALRPGGRLVFACWREPKANPWLMLPLQAAYKHVPKLPPVGPEDPGPFAFASEARVRAILESAGFANVGLTPHDFALDIAGGQGLDVAVTSALEIGPASRALQDQPADLRDAATAEIRTALAPHVRGDNVALPAAIWMVSATSG